MAKPKAPTITIEGAELIFRNFEGQVKQYNANGRKEFGVLLTAEHGAALEADGWNVKYLKDPETGEADLEKPWLPVACSFDNFPPQITMISSAGRQVLTEELVSVLDSVEIANCDVILRAYDWDVNGATGRKAYLKTMFITIEEDELQKKYASVKTAEDV